MAEQASRCPKCNQVFPEFVFNCPLCECILNTTLVEENPYPAKETSLVERMIGPPDATLERALDPRTVRTGDDPPHEVTSPTVPKPYPQKSNGVPVVIAGVDLRDKPLSVFEAFVVSRIDGSANVEEVRQGLDLSDIEIQVVLHALKDKGILTLRDPRPASIPPPATAGSRSRSVPPRQKPAPVEMPPSPDRKQRPATRRGVPPPKKLFQPSGERPKAQPPAWPSPPRENPLQRAIRLEKAGRIDEAVKVLEEAIASVRNPAPLYNRLALVLVKERRDFSRAEALLHKAVECDPQNQVYRRNHTKILSMAACITGLTLVPQ